MKNLERVNELATAEKNIAEYIERIKSIGFIGNPFERKHIGIVDCKNNKYDLKGVTDIIGEDKMNAAIIAFENILTAELHAKLAQTKAQLSNFQIVDKNIYSDKTNPF